MVMMTITRRSSLSGTVHTMTLPLSNRDLLRWQQGEITLDDLEHPLNAAEVRFLLTGITPEEDAALSVLD
jgi:hypothetical protein